MESALDMYYYECQVQHFLHKNISGYYCSCLHEYYEAWKNQNWLFGFQSVNLRI